APAPGVGSAGLPPPDPGARLGVGPQLPRQAERVRADRAHDLSERDRLSRAVRRGHHELALRELTAQRLELGALLAILRLELGLARRERGLPGRAIDRGLELEPAAREPELLELVVEIADRALLDVADALAQGALLAGPCG